MSSYRKMSNNFEEETLLYDQDSTGDLESYDETNETSFMTEEQQRNSESVQRYVEMHGINKKHKTVPF